LYILSIAIVFSLFFISSLSLLGIIHIFEANRAFFHAAALWAAFTDIWIKKSFLPGFHTFLSGFSLFQYLFKTFNFFITL